MNKFEKHLSTQPAKDNYLGVPKEFWLFSVYIIYILARPFLKESHPWSSKRGNPKATYAQWCKGSTQLNVFLGANITISGSLALSMLVGLVLRAFG
jgi:hypothetical protein